MAGNRPKLSSIGESFGGGTPGGSVDGERRSAEIHTTGRGDCVFCLGNSYHDVRGLLLLRQGGGRALWRLLYGVVTAIWRVCLHNLRLGCGRRCHSPLPLCASCDLVGRRTPFWHPVIKFASCGLECNPVDRMGKPGFIAPSTTCGFDAAPALSLYLRPDSSRGLRSDENRRRAGSFSRQCLP